MAAAPLTFRVVGDAQLQLPRNKKEAFETIAKYYACEAKIGAKIVSYGAGKSDVGISYMASVRLCNELLEPLGGWPAELVGLWAEYLGAIKAPMKKDDWAMTCFLIAHMEGEGFEGITRDDVVEFLEEDEEEGNFRSIHYDWLKFLQSGECTPHLYMDAAAWEASGDPAHPDFEALEEDDGPGPGAIVGAQVEQKGENPFLSRQSSTYLPSGRVQVFFPNAEEGDTELRDRQKSDVERFAQLQSSDAAAAAELKKTIMQQRISLAHRYTTILIEYKASTGMYAGGVFHFVFRLPKDYPIKAPLCHCLTPIWHPNILHEPDAEPREQNVCCSYLHDNSFADSSEQGYTPGMSLWKVVWAICLLLHRFDTEGLGIFTLSNPLNKEAADQFMNDEDGFMQKAKEYTQRYATSEYHAQLKRWHAFYPDQAVYESGCALGRASSIDKRLPKTTLQDDDDADDELEPVGHPSTAADDAECCVFMIPIDQTNYVEYRVAPTGRWYAAPVCDEVLLDLLRGEHNQFTQWLGVIEAVGSDPDSCNGALKNQVLKQGPPVYLASTSMLPLPSGATHVDVLWFAGGVPQAASSTTASEPEPAPEPEPEPEPVLAEFAGDARYLSARLQGSVDGEVRERLWDMHKQVYAFSDPTG
eukprot:COSAG04_NODE_1766_length_5644_cov_43.927915_2_plen_643_part_00